MHLRIQLVRVLYYRRIRGLPRIPIKATHGSSCCLDRLRNNNSVYHHIEGTSQEFSCFESIELIFLDQLSYDRRTSEIFSNHLQSYLFYIKYCILFFIFLRFFLLFCYFFQPYSEFFFLLLTLFYFLF